MMHSAKPETLDDIHLLSSRMSAAKRAVGTYVVQNWQSAAFLNASQIASEVGVSESLVVRFAQDLGFRGYPELQGTIRNLVRNDLGILGLFRSTTENISSTIDHRIQHSLDSDVANLTETLQGVLASDAEGAARLLNSARQIAVIGSRTSRAPASIAAIYLNAALANARLFDNSNDDVYDHLRSLDERDVVFAFILRHYNRQTVAEVAFARERGAKVIVVTDSIDSPLVPHADYVFYAAIAGPSFYLSQVGTVGIVNLLLLLVATLGDAERQATNLGELEKVYDRFYYSHPKRNSRTDNREA